MAKKKTKIRCTLSKEELQTLEDAQWLLDNEPEAFIDIINGDFP